jgi:DNA polymerase-3 subunit gamma/tau
LDELQNSKPLVPLVEPPKVEPAGLAKPKTTLKIPKLNSFLKGEIKKEGQDATQAIKKPDEPFTADQLREAWRQYVETRKIYQAEYQLLSQGIEIRDHQVIVPLHHPIQETLLNTIKSEALTFLREKLNNNTILLSGELTEMDEEKKVLYTNREKFDHLLEKNPKLKELKERLGLDTDF